jgi:hypothetical protein
VDPYVGAVAAIEGSELAIAAAVLLVIGAGVISRTWRETTQRSRSRPRDPSSPERFSYWYALVPFEDSDGSKDRPVLVLTHDGTDARVLKVTSKAKPGRTNYRRIDTSGWDRPGEAADSWLRTGKVLTVPLTSFRRHLGHETNTMFTRELVRIHPSEFH